MSQILWHETFRNLKFVTLLNVSTGNWLLVSPLFSLLLHVKALALSMDGAGDSGLTVALPYCSVPWWEKDSQWASGGLRQQLSVSNNDVYKTSTP